MLPCAKFQPTEVEPELEFLSSVYEEARKCPRFDNNQFRALFGSCGFFLRMKELMSGNEVIELLPVSNFEYLLLSVQGSEGLVVFKGLTNF